MPFIRAAVIIALLAVPGQTVTPEAPPQLTPGPHQVGFRVEQLRDHSRTIVAPVDFEGRRATTPTALPMQVSIWYPARAASGSGRMRNRDYRELFYTQETLADVSTEQRAGVGRDLRVLNRQQFGRELSDGQVAAALEAEGRAVRDAAVENGRFPLIAGGLGSPATAWPLAEYLASHGYVVVTTPALARTVTQQATRPGVALETHTRNLEFLVSAMVSRASIDPAKLGLIGINFDGLAALLFQARNMTAGAVISVDGWEGKESGREILRATQQFEAVRIRSPYLVIEQDEAKPPPGLSLDFTIFDSLKYAARRYVVIRGFGHAELAGHQLPLDQLAIDQRDNYAMLFDAIRRFLDAHVAGLAADTEGAFISERLRVDRRAAALPAAPTAEELEHIIWEQKDAARGIRLIRAALSANPDARLVDAQTLNLYAFRLAREGREQDAIALRQLAAEIR